ncbi:hypothetical protein EXVG_00371 [Emiliania huxleyi virus 202]|nr:hypothetical protein EXVG_00371 [Emiliania huxleyi virus 202]AHA54261.1 putative membrane protein [Emiliania huxleyi virus 18]AHA55308.1 putative membrane protein [Emiliania huxleyi virus 156]
METNTLLVIFGAVIFVLAFYISLRNNIMGARDFFLKYFPSFKDTFKKWKWIGSGSPGAAAPSASDVILKRELEKNTALMEMVKSAMASGEREVANQTKIDPLYEVDCSHLKTAGAYMSPSGPRPGGMDQTGSKTIKQANCDKLSIIINEKAQNKHIGTLAWMAFAHKHGS